MTLMNLSAGLIDVNMSLTVMFTSEPNQAHRAKPHSDSQLEMQTTVGKNCYHVREK